MKLKAGLGGGKHNAKRRSDLLVQICATCNAPMASGFYSVKWFMRSTFQIFFTLPKPGLFALRYAIVRRSPWPSCDRRESRCMFHFKSKAVIETTENSGSQNTELKGL